MLKSRRMLMSMALLSMALMASPSAVATEQAEYNYRDLPTSHPPNPKDRKIKMAQHKEALARKAEAKDFHVASLVCWISARAYRTKPPICKNEFSGNTLNGVTEADVVGTLQA